MEISKDLIICPHCKRGISHHEIICSGGKGTSSPRYWCKACRKKWSVGHKSINWQIHFGRLYSIHFTKPYEKSAIRARYGDFMTKTFQRLFDSRLRHYRETASSLEHTIKNAFIDTIKELHSKTKKRLGRDNRDNWDIIINHFDGEKSYDLDFKLFKAENAGMTFSKKQDMEHPLIHCHKCGGCSIIRYGFSPAGRRRFFCKDCEISFVLRAVHLFSFSYVKERLIEIYTRFNPENIKRFHLPMLEEICTKLATVFMHHLHLKEITQELKHLFTVHEIYRIREVEAFAKKIAIERQVIAMETLPPYQQDKQAAKVLMLGKPKEMEEYCAFELFGEVCGDVAPIDPLIY